MREIPKSAFRTRGYRLATVCVSSIGVGAVIGVPVGSAVGRVRGFGDFLPVFRSLASLHNGK